MRKETSFANLRPLPRICRRALGPCVAAPRCGSACSPGLKAPRNAPPWFTAPALIFMSSHKTGLPIACGQKNNTVASYKPSDAVTLSKFQDRGNTHNNET